MKYLDTNQENMLNKYTLKTVAVTLEILSILYLLTICMHLIIQLRPSFVY